MEVKAMSTKNPRLNVVLEPPLYLTIKNLAKREGISLSLKARDLLRQAIEYCEDFYWSKAANKREQTFSKKKALTHKQVWP
jgi:predicted DNA-binding protein